MNASNRKSAVVALAILGVTTCMLLVVWNRDDDTAERLGRALRDVCAMDADDPASRLRSSAIWVDSVGAVGSSVLIRCRLRRSCHLSTKALSLGPPELYIAGSVRAPETPLERIFKEGRPVPMYVTFRPNRRAAVSFCTTAVRTAPNGAITELESDSFDVEIEPSPR